MVKEVGSLMVMLQQFNRERMVILQRWPVSLREHVHATEVATLNEGRVIMLRRMSLMEGEKSCQRWSV